MNYITNGQICLNGHIISHNTKNIRVENYCSKCGSKTITACQQCSSPIKGGISYEDEYTYDFEECPKPQYCRDCGMPFPWTTKILTNSVALLALDEELPLEIKEIIRNAIPNLLVDTPDTPVAIAEYRQGIAKCSEIVRNSLYQLLVDVLSDSIKKALFG